MIDVHCFIVAYPHILQVLSCAGLVSGSCHRPLPETAIDLVIEYGGVGVIAWGFVSAGATRRALQATAIDADLEIAIFGFAGDGRPVLLGITERLDFVDALAHAADLARYRAISRPFSGRWPFRPGGSG